MSSGPCAHNPFLDLSTGEVVDIIVHKIQSEGIQLVEWHVLLHSRRMNVPRILSDYSFLIPDDDFDRTSQLIERAGLSLRAPSKLSVATEGDMSTKGRFFYIPSAIPSGIIVIERHLVIYPLSFAEFRSCEISEQWVQYSQLHRCTRILVPRPSAVYASLMRMMLRYPKNSSTWSTLEVDLSHLMLYHLLGYTLETVNEEDEKEDEDRRVAAIRTISEWGLRKEWGEEEAWMERVFSRFLHGSGLRFDV
ncbi:hypothetical protein BC827DRAFT_1214348 [Russula dissimulans]|nr:hypothetical protein BC827DRAFT_1214348 [Russula dissimulans]